MKTLPSFRHGESRAHPLAPRSRAWLIAVTVLATSASASAGPQEADFVNNAWVQELPTSEVNGGGSIGLSVLATLGCGVLSFLHFEHAGFNGWRLPSVMQRNPAIPNTLITATAGALCATATYQLLARQNRADKQSQLLRLPIEDRILDKLIGDVHRRLYTTARGGMQSTTPIAKTLRSIGLDQAVKDGWALKFAIQSKKPSSEIFLTFGHVLTNQDRELIRLLYRLRRESASTQPRDMSPIPASITRHPTKGEPCSGIGPCQPVSSPPVAAQVPR